MNAPKPANVARRSRNSVRRRSNRGSSTATRASFDAARTTILDRYYNEFHRGRPGAPAIGTFAPARGQADLSNEFVARRIIELAKAGERNPELLCEGALKLFRDQPRPADDKPFQPLPGGK
jgi:hypothetical protein